MLAIGRALMANPELILMDEPSEGLSPRLVQQVRRDHAAAAGAGARDPAGRAEPALALSVADDVYVLSAGQFVFQGTPAELAKETEVLDQHLGVSGVKTGLIGDRNGEAITPSADTRHRALGLLRREDPAAPDRRFGRHRHRRHRLRRLGDVGERRSCCRITARSARR